MSSRPTVSVTAFRVKVAHASDSALQRLSGVPVPATMAILLALVVGGAILGGALGAFLVVLAAAAVGWLAYLAWPRLGSGERLMRAAVLLLLLAIALVGGLSHALVI